MKQVGLPMSMQAPSKFKDDDPLIYATSNLIVTHPYTVSFVVVLSSCRNLFPVREDKRDWKSSTLYCTYICGKLVTWCP